MPPALEQRHRGAAGFKNDMWRIFLLFGIAVLFLIAVSVVGRVSEAMQRKRMKK